MAMETAGKPTFAERRGERRVNRHLSGPPYQTAEGVVTVDRRSHLDRRANWIGDFVVETDDKPKLSVASLITRLEYLQQEFGDLPVTLRDADTQWLFSLEPRHVQVVPGRDAADPRLEIAVAYGDPMEMPGRSL